MERRKAPPYQLIAGDHYNLTLGVLAAFALATAKDQKNLPPFWRWQLNAYTNWNLTFILLRLAAQQQQWDPFLLVNSIGILLGFRTAFCQGLDDNMRKKIAGLGLPLPRWLFKILDHICHTVPPAVLLASLVSRNQRVPRINVVYAMVLSTWFSFRQGARLDASDVYVPHPWKRAWLGIIVGAFTTPPLVNALVDRSAKRSLLCTLVMLAPWLMARLDPNLRRDYNFECLLSRAQQLQREAELKAEQKYATKPKNGTNGKGGSPDENHGSPKGPRRVMSEAPLRMRKGEMSP